MTDPTQVFACGVALGTLLATVVALIVASVTKSKMTARTAAEYLWQLRVRAAMGRKFETKAEFFESLHTAAKEIHNVTGVDVTEHIDIRVTK